MCWHNGTPGRILDPVSSSSRNVVSLFPFRRDAIVSAVVSVLLPPNSPEVRCTNYRLVLDVQYSYAMQQLKLSTDQIKYLCEEASRAGTQGQRAEIFACEVARASAGELSMKNSFFF